MSKLISKPSELRYWLLHAASSKFRGMRRLPPLASVMLAVQNAAPIRGEHLFASPLSTVKAEDKTMPNIRMYPVFH